ncbi:MAG: DUF6107 family protein [Pseudomonadota bacterium]
MRIILGEAPPAYFIAKFAGAVAGSLISVAYVLPRGRREAWLRFAVGVVTGMVFGGAVGLKLASFFSLPPSIDATEVAVMGAAFTSLMAWWSLGVLQRLSERWPHTMPDPFKKIDLKDQDR